MFFRNFGKFVPAYTASHLTRQFLLSHFPLKRLYSVNATGTVYRCGQVTVMACYINTAVHSDVVPIEDAAHL